MTSSPAANAGAFNKLEGARARKFVDRVNAVWTGSAFDPEKTAVYVRSVPFLAGWSLAEISDATSMPEKKCVCLDNTSQCVVLQYDATFIENFCRSQALRLDRHTAPDYVRFWLEYVRTGTDRFILAETVDDLPWREDPTPQARKSLARAIMPLTLVDSTPALFVFKGCLLFRDALLDCGLEVTYDGKLAITSREIVAEDLTVIDPFTGF